LFQAVDPIFEERGRDPASLLTYLEFAKYYIDRRRKNIGNHSCGSDREGVLDVTTWNSQNLEFNYYFPHFGDVFTGSPISFVADGSPNLSTHADLNPATFSVSNIAPGVEQIAYFYPSAAYPQGVDLVSANFNGFNISGPLADSPIIAAFVDGSSTVTGLTDASVSFAADSVTVNLAGDNFTAGSIGLIDVQFAVPEPGSLLVFASGLAVILGIARLKRLRSPNCGITVTV
jgi:hypothetical protein